VATQCEEEGRGVTHSGESVVSQIYRSRQLRTEVGVKRSEVYLDLRVGLTNEGNATVPVQATARLHAVEAEKFHAKLGKAIAQARALHDRRVARGEEDAR
jgi:hypothetical protein